MFNHLCLCKSSLVKLLGNIPMTNTSDIICNKQIYL